jgi:hypothetical protein
VPAVAIRATERLPDQPLHRGFPEPSTYENLIGFSAFSLQD